jgi:hypothetical protein
MVRRTTYGKSTPQAARLHKTQSGLRPFVRFVTPHFCFCEKLLRSFLIAKAKTSFTCSRYAKLGLKFVEKYKKGLEKM